MAILAIIVVACLLPFTAARADDIEPVPPVESVTASVSSVVEEVLVEGQEPRYVAPTLRDRIGRIWAPVLINGRGPFRLVLDTGASHSAIIPSVAASLGIPPVGKTVRLLGVTGSAIVPTISVDRLEVGDLLITGAMLPIVADVFGGAEGVLGSAGLKDKRISIDFRRDRIEITHSKRERPGAGFTVVVVCNPQSTGHALVGPPAAESCVSPTQPPSSAQRVAERVFGALERFLHVEAASGVVLLVAAAAAFAWANSPAADSYYDLWHLMLSVGIGERQFSQSLHFLINDGLMTVFFLVVGMEIRREMGEGALADLRHAALPLAAAIGGVAVPAAIYLALNREGLLSRGWAVPTATDIAFAIGVLALLGKSIPGSVRIFLLALAIIDDVVAVVVIAFFYSGGLDYSGLFIVGAGVLLVLALQWIGVGSAWVYVVPGAVVWYGMLQAGAHPTLAGVILGLMTPVTAVRVQALHPWVAYAIMPLFALANAGVSLDGMDLSDGESLSVMLGVLVALLVGKPIGIVLSSWIVVRMRWCVLPPGLTWRGVWLVGCLGGIGFTMSIFIATLAFEEAHLLAASKLGVLLASVAAGVLGLAWGRVVVRNLRFTAGP